MKLVVTGNIGAGKSTVIDMLMPLLPDYTLFDFDKAVAGLYENRDVQEWLDTAFGTHDKKQISDIVHENPVAMKNLEIILNARLVTLVHYGAELNDVVFDLPLYFEYENIWNIDPDFVIVIDTPKEVRFNRVKLRNGWSDEKIESVMAKQLSDEEKRTRGDLSIFNDCDLETLKERVEQTVNCVKALY